MPGAELLVPIAVGYLIGAIPSGVLIGRLRGVDPRGSGSGRTGTTNALRTLGPRWGAVVALLDVTKGVAAVLIGNAIGPEPWGGALASVAAVVGHVRSIFIGFTGGRGAATGAGVSFVLAPLAASVAFAAFVLIIWRTRFVSLGSIQAGVTVPVISLVLHAVGWVGVEVPVATALSGAVVILAHSDNIQRLRNGTERKAGSA